MASVAQHPGLCCPVLELRQYALKSGGFDKLQRLFERTFIREQEAVGMHLVGFFHQVGNPHRFVWIRGFDGMTQRHDAYAAFYDSELWRDLREATNATLVDSGDVLLLRPIDGRGFLRGPTPGPESTASAPGRIIVSLLSRGSPVDATGRAAFTQAIDGTRLQSVAVLETETGENTWTRHPVRTGEHVLAAFSWVDAPGVEDALVRLHSALAPNARTRPVDHLVLKPATCSRLR